MPQRLILLRADGSSELLAGVPFRDLPEVPTNAIDRARWSGPRPEDVPADALARAVFDGYRVVGVHPFAGAPALLLVLEPNT